MFGGSSSESEEEEKIEDIRKGGKRKICENDNRTQRMKRTAEVLQSKDYKEYVNAAIASRGYTIPELGILKGMCMPLVRTFDMEVLNKFSKIAVAKYNKDNGTKYKLDHVVRGNFKRMGSRYYHYITFIVKESQESDGLELQATVSRQYKDFRVDECIISQF